MSLLPRTGKKWLPRARLWRLILLQHPDGYWDASEGVALALNAHRDDADDSNDCPLSAQAEAISDTLPEIVLSAAEPEGAEPLSPEEERQLKLRIWVRGLLWLFVLSPAAAFRRLAFARCASAPAGCRSCCCLPLLLLTTGRRSVLLHRRRPSPPWSSRM